MHNLVRSQFVKLHSSSLSSTATLSVVDEPSLSPTELAPIAEVEAAAAAAAALDVASVVESSLNDTDFVCLVFACDEEMMNEEVAPSEVLFSALNSLFSISEQTKN